MKQRQLKIDYSVCQRDELSKEDRQLVDAAQEATTHSYAPYSHFHVGAAVRLADGHLVIGANQENAAYPSGLCAERTALFAAQAQYPSEAVTTLAICARNEAGEYTKEPAWPCGACRQVMSQVEERYHQPMRILLSSAEEVYVFDSVRCLLPFTFVDENMR